ncbi:NrsF family protein [soil metagenome]
MQTDDLINALAGNVRPVSRNPVESRIALGLMAGAIVTLATIMLTLGFRPDLATAMHSFSFWMKWTYTISLGVGAILATIHLSRPDASRAQWLWLLVIPFVLLAAVAANELIRTPVSGWLPLWLGQSWKRCAVFVFLLSLPLFGGLIWAFRQFAPTRLRLAGGVAGLASGACAATLYGLHCPEASATFVLTWYTLGIGLAGAAGALIGPRLMRW